jgi:hypothetical protein
VVSTLSPLLLFHPCSSVAAVGRRRTLGGLSLFLPALEDEGPYAGAGVAGLLRGDAGARTTDYAGAIHRGPAPQLGPLGARSLGELSPQIQAPSLHAAG